MASATTSHTNKADLVSDVSRAEWFKAPTEWPPRQLAASVESDSDTDSVSCAYTVRIEDRSSESC